MSGVAHGELDDTQRRSMLVRAVIASTIGTSIEWYDFFLYSIVTGLVFAKTFFPDADPNTGLPFGLQQVFLRGEAQTNTVVRLGQSLFSQFTDIRSSMGAELRFQVPILNVPFRLIYAYNPNARADQVIDGFPFFFNEKKSVFRFSVGRTF